MRTRDKKVDSNKRRFSYFAALMLLLPLGTQPIEAQTAYAVFDDTDHSLTFRYDTNMPDSAFEMTYEEYSSIGRVPSWFAKCTVVTTVVFDKSFAQYRPEDCSYWFYQYDRLKTIEGLENLNTEKAVSMRGMFFNCKALTALDVSHFNTQNVTDMNGMFRYCKELTTLDVSNFNTENVTDMGSMFSVCKLITSLNLSNFNTENVTDMSYMFSDSHSLTNIILDNFDTKQVKNMGYMFYNCKTLPTLDLPAFNTGNVTDMTWMFRSCAALKSIYANETFTTDSIHMEEDAGKDMFKGCKTLEGAIKYDDNKTDYQYANYTTGYFTYKAATEVNSIDMIDKMQKIEAFYDLSGQQLASPRKGLNIIRKGSNTVKIFVK